MEAERLVALTRLGGDGEAGGRFVSDVRAGRSVTIWAKR
jgi:hypothetical protein